MRDRWPLAGDAQDVVDRALLAGHLTRRGAVRVHRLAMTVADLAELPRPDQWCVETAMRLRAGHALLLPAPQGTQQVSMRPVQDPDLDVPA